MSPIGFNIHPRWVAEQGLERFLAPFRQTGLDTLEFELDGLLPDWPGFEPLMAAADGLGMGLCFHAPYRGQNRITGFAGPRRNELEALVGPMLAIAQAWAERKGHLMTMVAHGAVGQTAEQESLKEDTLEFLKWALDRFDGLRLALENNHPPAPGEAKVGATRAGVLAVVRALNHPRLGVCWDLGHDYLAGAGVEIEAEWLASLVHIHVHDVDAVGQDHYPLVCGRVPHTIWLGLARQAGFHGIATLEIKGGQLAGWSQGKVQAALADSFTTIAEELL